MMEIVTSIVLLFLGIVLLVTIHICIVGRAFGRVSSGNNNGGESQFGIMTRSASMSQDDIKKLPCFDYKVEEEMREKMKNSGCSTTMDDCAVCLENFKVGEKCRLLPKCNHSFHAQCIDSWLIKNGACPICRTGADIELQIICGQSSISIPSEVSGVELT